MAGNARQNHNTCRSRIAAGALLLASTALSSCGGGDIGGGSGGLDPLVADVGIAYVRQPVPEMDTADIRGPISFTPGGDLIFRELASPGAAERNVTAAVTGSMGDVKDVEAAYDGSKLLFALRLPDIDGAAPEDQPTWNIWEYEIASNSLRRVIQRDLQSEAGQDIAPHYLPDGRIIFSSTRQRTSKALLVDEDKTQFSALDESRNNPAFVLHVMDDDGTNIQQVSFNQSHDLDPIVLESGEVVFSRWDNAGSNNAVHLYKMNPDGTNLQLLYGAGSHDTGTDGATVQFTQAREFPGGGVITLLKPFTGAYQGGDIVKIDTANYVDNTQPTAINQGLMSGPAQASVAFNTVRSDNLPSPGGRFSSFYPLWDGTNRALVGWSQCRLLENNLILPCTTDSLNNPNAIEAPPLYSVYLYDMDEQTQQPIFIPQEGFLYRDVVAAQPRRLPTIIFDQAGPAGTDFDPDLVGLNLGILNIRSVYDFDGSFNNLGATGIPDIDSMANPAVTDADNRPARFLRIVKAVSIPDDNLVDLNGADFGVSAGQLMREIIGYAPIEPDGSVRVKVPANVPFAISVLDRDGKRITNRHQNWLQVRPGEILNCTGCHAANSTASHGREDAFTSIHDGAGSTGVPFYNNTVLALVNQGDSMAEARTRADATALNLLVDIRFEDVWTDDSLAGLSKAASFDYFYATPDPDPTQPAVLNVPVAPLSSACWQDAPNNKYSWNNLCRIIIHYETHIHPLWGLDRGASTCTSTDCHTRGNAGVTVEPAGQLELTDGVANNGQFTAYRELLANDLELELDINGNLAIREELVFDANNEPVFELDENGDPVLDINNNPVQQVRTFTVSSSMRTAGARSSNGFFDRFSDAGIGTVNHVGMLNPAELKLIAEWLDIGGQYYNNPFDVPQ